VNGRPPATVEIVCISAGELAPIADRLAAVYYAAFAAPPYHRDAAQAAAFADTLAQHARRRDFQCCVAREGSGGRIAGFSYGYSGVAGQWWHDVVAGAMPREMAESWLKGSFELAELAVLPEAQGRGLGGRLHDTLLDGQRNRTAVLSTIQEETPALQLYRKRGWIELVPRLWFPNVAEAYLIMGIDLSRWRARRVRQ
jgi:ribosomal protein S18 acetylase RimI-like enzyme